MKTQPELSHETEIKRERAAALLGAWLRRLAANLMRIVRGAGKPNDLAEEMSAALTAFKDYHEAVGEEPSSYEISQALSIGEKFEDWRQMKDEGRTTEQDMERWRADGTIEQELAFAAICRGALQHVASTLVHQPIHIASGESDVYEAIFRIERVREERRRGQAKPRKAVFKRKRRRKSVGGPSFEL